MIAGEDHMKGRRESLTLQGLRFPLIFLILLVLLLLVLLAGLPPLTACGL
jgi:hypothetical protein